MTSSRVMATTAAAMVLTSTGVTSRGKGKKNQNPNGASTKRGGSAAALQFIPAADRPVWLHVGMALHWTAWGDKARAIWDSWSKTCLEKYDETDQAATWRGFRTNRDKAKTLATLFAMAIEHGWDPAVETTQAGGASPHSWDDPDTSILDDRRGDLPAFPLDVFSPSWQTWATNAAHGAGSAVDHVVVPLLAVASSLVGTARRVQASKLVVGAADLLGPPSSAHLAPARRLDWM